METKKTIQEIQRLAFQHGLNGLDPQDLHSDIYMAAYYQGDLSRRRLNAMKQEEEVRREMGVTF